MRYRKPNDLGLDLSRSPKLKVIMPHEITATICLSGPVSELQAFKNGLTLILTFQGHQRSKVMVPTERQCMTSYDRLIATIWLFGPVSEIQPFKTE